MASRMTLLFAVVFLAVLAAPAAQAQLLGIINISGTVSCSIGGTTSTTTAPAFPNALVQLQCGGNVISSSTTNSNGVFNISLNMLTSLLNTLLSSCSLVVNTPLSNCNLLLPTGGVLQSALQLLTGGGLLGGLLGIVNLIPTGFSLVQSLA